MAIDTATLKALIAAELEQVSDARVVTQIRTLLVEPEAVLRNWDYGDPGTQYPCWAVLSDVAANTGIAYCEHGFGPKCPWGLVWLGGDEPMSMGMDSAWYPTFLDAFFDSSSASDLPIWRVFRTNPSGTREPITNESSWEATWDEVMQRRKDDPQSRYDCNHSIPFRSGYRSK